MARLPGVIDQGYARGDRPSGRVANLRFDALDDAAQAVEAVSGAFQIRDDKAAAKILDASKGAFETRYGEAAAGYDGREAGFATKMLGSFDNHFTPVAQDPTYSEGVRYALQRRLDGYRAEFGDRAIRTETQGRAGVVAEQRRVKDTAALGGLTIDFNGKFSGKYQARADSFDGSDPAFAQNVVGDFDTEAKDAIEAAPAPLRPALEAALASRRVAVHAAALEAQDKGHDAFVAHNADSVISALTNNVLSNPAAFATTQADIDAAAAGVPKGLRDAFIKGARGDVATARIEGLVLRDDAATAKAELNDGRYDQVLAPERKAALLARVEAAESGGPRSLDDWRAAYEADARLDGEVEARARGGTTGFSLQEIAGAFTPREQAAAEQRLKEADMVFAATGNLKGQANADLAARANAPAPDPADPDYAAKSRAWELGRKAAAGELAAREKDPAAWAMASDRPNDVGAQVQGALQGYLEADTPQAQAKAAMTYAGYTLNWQARAGIAAGAQRVFTKDQASDLVTSYASAEPAAKTQALAALAGLWNALPLAAKLQDGRTVAPRAMAARELVKAGLAPADVSAMTDLADNRGKLALYAEAAANPAAHQALSAKGAEAQLQGLVEARLAPFFASANALPGSAEQNAGRLSRARIMARQLVLTKGLSAREAAQAATADLTDDYRFVDGWRMPQAQASQPRGLGSTKGATARIGAAQVLSDLLADDGKLLYAAPGHGITEAQAHLKSADVARQHARWVTTEDDAGLMLMLPTERGWTPAADRYGRAVRLGWDALDQVALAGPGYKLGQWMTPPPAAALPPRLDPGKARAAFAAAIEGRESGGDPRAVSPKGAAGLRQLMTGTAKWQAGMDRDPVFAGKSDDQVHAMLLADPALNRRLSDNHIAFLARRYGGNIGLMAAAYNAGPEAVDGWLKGIGDPRRGRLSLDEWVAHIPYKETRDYVRAVLPRALENLKKG